MNFTVDLPNNTTIKVTAGDPEQVVRVLSFAFPDEKIWLFACNRGRICYINGECISSVSVLKDVAGDTLLEGISERMVHELQKQWEAMNVGPMKLDFEPIPNVDFMFESSEKDFYSWTEVTSAFEASPTRTAEENYDDQHPQSTH